MKKILLILVAAFLLPGLAMAQDGRNRLTTTVIADALAQLPAQNQEIYNTMMADLAGTGAEGTVKLAGMLVPADKGQNATIEYALNGLAAYVSAPGREAMAESMSSGLETAIDACTDMPNKCFLISLLGITGNESNIPFLKKYLDNNDTADQALNAITRLPGAKKVIARLIEESNEPDVNLVRLIPELGIEGLEEKLITWTEQIPVGGRADFYRALSYTGGAKSFDLIGKAAKKAGYGHDIDYSAKAYTTMLTNGKGFDDRRLKAAKDIVNGKAPDFIRGAALTALFGLEGKKALPQLEKAIKSGSREYRVNALRQCEPWADKQVYTAINKASLKSKDSNAVADVINWYGANGTASEIDFVIDAFSNSNPAITSSAIKAAGMIGGEKALAALAAQMDTDNRDMAATALMYFNGNIADCVNTLLSNDNPETRAVAVDLASKRHVKKAMPMIVDIIEGSDGAIKPAAYRALANVATVKDLDTLVKIAAKASGTDRTAVANAIKSVLTGMPSEEQYSVLKPYLDNNVAHLYPALAQCGTKEAVNVLKTAYDKGDKDAFDALLTVDNRDMIPVLYEIATKNPNVATPALKRYAALARRSGYNGTQLFDIYTKGLAATKDAAVENRLIEGLGETRVFPALAVAKEYIKNPATAASSAAAIRTIASKNNYTGADVVSALEAAKAYYVAEGSADSGYAVDDINGMIARMTFNPVFKLSPEEEAEGFELLFDGTSLDRWKGAKTNYVPVDGAIYVTAQYGGHGNGNLYTDKEYSDFIYRFEFCFDSPGVNNGVGIRTSEGVDAAYYGMEIQVLEHDAPIYADLRPYQVHGSVYGIIPAKRIKSPEPGVWNTEEIRAVGDHITVTVNGEVIVDGDIRKACKGHNVAPDGSRNNPYTVDHLNHPGLFNKKGYISFCGHGPGVRFRNIRIKDLSKD